MFIHRNTCFVLVSMEQCMPRVSMPYGRSNTTEVFTCIFCCRVALQTSRQPHHLASRARIRPQGRVRSARPCMVRIGFPVNRTCMNTSLKTAKEFDKY